MKIVLMKNIKYDFDSVWIVEDCAPDCDYVPASKEIDVDFPMIEVDINTAKIKAIDEDIKKAKAGIEMLEQAKAELLAIPDMSGER